jgi:hypothetical protein
MMWLMITQRQPGDNVVVLKHFDTRLTALVVAYAAIALFFGIWFFTSALLANTSISSNHKTIGVFFVAAFSLFLAIACLHSFITALFYSRSIILLDGKLGTASVHSSRVDWQAYCDVTDIREVLVAYEKRTCELWIVTHAHKKIALLSGSRTFIQDFAQEVLYEISKTVPDLPRYREEPIGYSGTPRPHQPIYTIIQASSENGCDSIRIPYGRVRCYQPNAKRSWFASKTQTLDCPGLVIRITSEGIQFEHPIYSERLAWESIAKCEIETEDIQVPESGTNAVHWLVLTLTTRSLVAISGMSGPDAEWMFFLVEQEPIAASDSNSRA